MIPRCTDHAASEKCVLFWGALSTFRVLPVHQLANVMLYLAADWIDCKQVMANVKDEDKCTCPRA